MDRTAAEQLRAHLEAVIRGGWHARDPEAQVTSVLRADNMIDITVVSELFEDKNGLEREAFFWPVFDPVPKYDLIYMTYCLLLTPEEAARIGSPTGKDNRDDWA